MRALQDILVRLEAAEGPDRELDARLYVALIGRLKMGNIEQMIAERAASHPDNNVWLDGARDWQVKPYTASLDAALALQERVLDYTVDLTIYRTNCGEFKSKTAARLFCPYGDIHEHRGDAPTPALALLTALIRALIAREAEPEAGA